VSIGVARFPVDGTSAGELLAAARSALDEARSGARGTITEATSQPAG
jgi:GGDEF domain-containing protein